MHVSSCAAEVEHYSGKNLDELDCENLYCDVINTVYIFENQCRPTGEKLQ